MSAEGKTIIFSTHRMEQVEEICDEIVLVNKGKKILEGEVKELKQRFKENKFRVSFKDEIKNGLMDNLNVVERNAGKVVVKFGGEHQGNQLLRLFIENGVEVTSFNEELPSINEIFIRQVGANN